MMGALVAFLLGIILGPRVKKALNETPPPKGWEGETPPRYSPPKHEEHPPAPPEGWKRHEVPYPPKLEKRAAEVLGVVWGLGPGGKYGPEVDDWKSDGHPYAVLFRAEEYGGMKAIGVYVEDVKEKPPEQKNPPPGRPPPKAMPGGWRAHPSPMPPSVPQTAWRLLSSLWAGGEGTYKTIFDNWWKSDDKEPYDVLFRAEYHGDKKGVTAYVKR